MRPFAPWIDRHRFDDGTGLKGRRQARIVSSAATALAAGAVAAAMGVACHTVAFIWLDRPVLPVFDGWAPWDSLRSVIEGSSSSFEALTALHKEHRVIVVKLMFVADLFAGGRDRIACAASLAFQGVQIAIWLTDPTSPRSGSGAPRSRRWPMSPLIERLRRRRAPTLPEPC